MNIGIAGAGLVGRLLAFKLTQLGYTVTLFEKDKLAENSSCGIMAAGMVAPYSELEQSELAIYELGISSIKLWQAWLSELGCPELFKLKGTLVVAHPQDQQELPHFIHKINYKKNCPIHYLTDSELIELEPDLKLKSHKFLYIENEGQVNSEGLFNVLQQKLYELKVKWYWGQPVINLMPYRIITEQQDYQFDWVFDCRGMGAQIQLSGLRGVRGEIIYVDAPEVKLTRPIRVMHPRFPIYIVPGLFPRYIIGATSIESEDYSPISIRSTLELLSVAYSLHSGFSEARIVKCLTNCRPAMPNNLPLVNHKSGFTIINGLYRHGYLIGPAVIQQAINYFLGKERQ